MSKIKQLIPSKCKYLKKNNFEFKHVSVTPKPKCKYIYLKCKKTTKKYIKYIFTKYLSCTQSLFGIPKKKKREKKTPRRVYSVNYDRILFTYSLYSAANNQMGIENCEHSIFICS